MPKGVPVATVAIGNAANAGLLAVRILATSDKSLLDKMLLYQVLAPDQFSCWKLVTSLLVWHQIYQAISLISTAMS